MSGAFLFVCCEQVLTMASLLSTSPRVRPGGVNLVAQCRSKHGALDVVGLSDFEKTETGKEQRHTEHESRTESKTGKKRQEEAHKRTDTRTEDNGKRAHDNETRKTQDNQMRKNAQITNARG
eukprot:gnl/TRDRNA2_/TRDRNA2_206992_c0_seq1.p1 gnl/TRDRNA2_/TRDRNA2_206992_c0~~gnl/TRDRNA2_/TRDRNA2_206992_c0_seq1.p1  ORF type:complete len:122 (+),score=11.80 gnl/TRDRNA2_/TRDRNA2_206992_c0_seq1:44-409(+)